MPGMDDMYAQVVGTVERTAGDAPSDPWWLDVSTAFGLALARPVDAADSSGSGVSGTVTGGAAAQIIAEPGADGSDPDPAQTVRSFQADAFVTAIDTPGQPGVTYEVYVPGLVAQAWQNISFSQGGATWKVTVTGVQAGVWAWPRVDPGPDPELV